MADAPTRTRHRLAVASRVLAAGVAGFALTSAATVAGTALLVHVAGWPRAHAVATSTVPAFALYAGVIVWVFAQASLARIWTVLTAATLLFAALGAVVAR